MIALYRSRLRLLTVIGLLLALLMAQSCNLVKENDAVREVCIDPIANTVWQVRENNIVQEFDPKAQKVVREFSFVPATEYRYAGQVFVSPKYLFLSGPELVVYSKSDLSVVARKASLSKIFPAGSFNQVAEAMIGKAESGYYDYRHLAVTDERNNNHYYDLMTDQAVTPQEHERYGEAIRMQAVMLSNRELFDGAGIAIPGQVPAPRDNIRYFKAAMIYADSSISVFQHKTDVMPGSASYITCLTSNGKERWQLTSTQLSQQDYRLSPSDIGRCFVNGSSLFLYFENQFYCELLGKRRVKKFFALYSIDLATGKINWQYDNFATSDVKSKCEGMLPKSAY